MGDEQHEGGESTLQEEKELYELDAKYGPLVKDDLFGDFRYQREVLDNLANQGFLSTAKGMKKHNSFLGFLMTANVQQDIGAKVTFLQEKSI